MLRFLTFWSWCIINPESCPVCTTCSRMAVAEVCVRVSVRITEHALYTKAKGIKLYASLWNPHSIRDWAIEPLPHSSSTVWSVYLPPPQTNPSPQPASHQHEADHKLSGKRRMRIIRFPARLVISGIFVWYTKPTFNLIRSLYMHLVFAWKIQ